MTYSFFGTCYEDIDIFYDCLISMAKQSVAPNEIIIIDSSKKPISQDIFAKIRKKPLWSLVCRV